MTETAPPRERALPTGPMVGRPVVGRGGRLILLSFLMLFVELVLIRWTLANVVYLAFFTNFILLAAFLGIGVGFLRAHAEQSRFPLAAPVLVGLVTFVLLFPVQIGSLGTGQLNGHFGLPALPQWVMLPALFLGSTAVMAFIAEGVARVFATFEPLEAYRLDILGSVLGIVAFSLLSFLGAPPLVWALVIVGTYVVLGERGRMQTAALAALVVLFGIQSFIPGQSWSPYYKVTTSSGPPESPVRIGVNNIPHQSIHPVSSLVDKHPFYLFTYERLRDNPLRDVLIVGAGNGNDVALALRQGAQWIDAVEIDPVIYELGRERHPDRPYRDPRVRIVIDDGRAFLERTQRRYDLILFALPDSLTLVGGQSALRLESFLFTEEAFREVRAHLRPGGAFSAYNYYSSHVFKRYAHTLERIYGYPPCVDHGSELGGRHQAVMTIGRDPGDVACAAEPAAAVRPPEPSTDDHPFPYLRGRTIPTRYLWALALILAVSVVLVRWTSGPLTRMRPYVDLFFMGSAFLLLETKNVVQFALLFGTTWFVYALVFAGILLSVLAAIEVARRFAISRAWILYVLLGVSLAVAFVVPSATLLALPVVPRFLAATALAFTPIFLANLIFSRRFRDVGSSVIAFGANLLGAMVGGVLEYGSLVVGFRALLIAVAVLYALAFLTGRRHLALRPA